MLFKSYAKVFILVFTFCLLCNFSFALITDNLLFHYNLNESSGNATDQKNILNLTQSGTVPTVYDGILNNSRGTFSASNYFSGTNPYVFTSNYSYTLNAWYYVTGSCTDDYGGVVFGTTTTNDEFHIYCDTGRYWVIAYAKSVDSGLTIPLNKWQMITMTYNGSTNKVVSVFVNGSFVKNSTSTTQNGVTSNSVLIGKVSNGYPFDHGYIDEVTLWNRTLTNAEILGLYQNYTSGKGYPFNYTDPLIPPNRTELISPCNSSVTVNSTGVNVYFNWSNTTDINGDPFNFSISIDSTILASEITNLYFNYSFNNSWNTLYYLYLNVTDKDGTSQSSNVCTLDLCVNHYIANWTECENGEQTKLYYDENNCNSLLEIPTDYNSTRSCSSYEHIHFDFQENFYYHIFFWIIIILLFNYAWHTQNNYLKFSYSLLSLVILFYSFYIQDSLFINAIEHEIIARDIIKYALWLGSLYFMFLGIYWLFKGKD